MADHPTTLDLTRYYLERMSDIDLQDLEEVGRLMIPDLPSGFFARPDPRINGLIAELPRMTEADLESIGQADSSCPICLVSYRAFIAEEEMAMAMEHSSAVVPEELGVTKLEQSCGHVYCRKDIIKWMRTASKSCPTCRRPFLPPLEHEATPASPPLASEGSGFALRATPAEMNGLLEQLASPAEIPQADLEQHLARAGVFADFEQFLMGGPSPHIRQPQPEADDDRQDYYGMYS